MPLLPYPSLDKAQGALEAAWDAIADGRCEYRGRCDTPDHEQAVWVLIGYAQQQMAMQSAGVPPYTDKMPPWVDNAAFLKQLQRWKNSGMSDGINFGQLFATLLPMFTGQLLRLGACHPVAK